MSDILRFVNNEDNVSDDDLEDLVGEIDNDDASDVEIPTVGDTGKYKISGFVCQPFLQISSFFYWDNSFERL